MQFVPGAVIYTLFNHGLFYKFVSEHYDRHAKLVGRQNRCNTESCSTMLSKIVLYNSGYVLMNMAAKNGNHIHL